MVSGAALDTHAGGPEAQHPREPAWDGLGPLFPSPRLLETIRGPRDPLHCDQVTRRGQVLCRAQSLQDEEEWAGRGLREVGGQGVGPSQNRSESSQLLMSHS